MDSTWQEFLREIEAARAIAPRAARIEFRAEDDDENLGTLEGHFSVFNVWYEVNSFFEGQFLERIAPGAFAKTIAENRSNMKVLFDHGMDRSIGNKVLGSITDLREDDIGPFYEVPLFDTSYNRDLLPGLKAGEYGSSFRFRVIVDEWNDDPGTSDHNPDGLPERTIKEVRTSEFGPVTFPANPSATAGVRSLTDDVYEPLREMNPDHYRNLLSRAREVRTPNHPPTEGREGAAETAEEPPRHSAGTPAARRTAVRQLFAPNDKEK